MKYLAILACLFLASNSHAARLPRPKDEVAKIAVGPKAALATEANDDESADDATDAVDKPIHKPVVTTTDAPRAEEPVEPVEPEVTKPPMTKPAMTKPAVTKPALKATAKSVRDEGSISIHGVDEAPAAAAAEVDNGDDEPVAKIDTSKPKPGALKPQILKVDGAASATVREEKPGPVPAHVEKAAEAKSLESKPVLDGVTAEQSQKWLENGNTRYVTHKFRADGRGDKERAKKEVKPHAIVLSCSDSRVPPELIFDQGLGEIVTIRVAGEVLDDSVIASVEQTVINDHPHLLVVLGHTQCAAIEAAFNWKDKASFGSDALDRMVSEIKPHLKTLTSPTRSPGLQVEAALQADGVARELKERSEVVKKAVDSGELKIRTGLYWVDTGKVKFY